MIYTDEDGYLIGDGEIIYFGKGTKVTVVESHMGVSYTFRLEEVVEGIEEFFAGRCKINDIYFLRISQSICI